MRWHSSRFSDGDFDRDLYATPPAVGGYAEPAFPPVQHRKGTTSKRPWALWLLLAGTAIFAAERHYRLAQREALLELHRRDFAVLQFDRLDLQAKIRHLEFERDIWKLRGESAEKANDSFFELRHRTP